MSSNFKQWNPLKNRQQSDVQYDADLFRADGAQAGIFAKEVFNKFAYQNSTFVSALAQMLSDKGYAISDSDYNTLIAALSNMLTKADGLSGIFKIETITATGTWQVPAGITFAFAFVRGSGGGGGCGGNGGAARGGGGGGGGAGAILRWRPIILTPLETCNITINPGGNGAPAASYVSGSTGGSVSFVCTSETISADGGAGGGAGGASAGGAGGIIGNFISPLKPSAASGTIVQSDWDDYTYSPASRNISGSKSGADGGVGGAGAGGAGNGGGPNGGAGGIAGSNDAGDDATPNSGCGGGGGTGGFSAPGGFAGGNGASGFVKIMYIISNPIAP